MQVNFGRVLTAMVTPFDEEGRVDYDEAVRLANFLLENGSDGVVLAGTTGESPTLTHQEEFELFKAVYDSLKNKGTIIAGTGSNSTETAINSTKIAENVGVHGVLLVAPYYNKPPQEGLYQHFKAIAKSTSLPCILYNIPGRTGVNVNPDTVIRLSEIDNIIALKDATGSTEQVSQILTSVKENFLIYSGDDSMTLPMLAVGGYGVISVASHVVGPEIREMIMDFVNGNITKAKDMHLKLYPIFKAMFTSTNPIPVKAATNLIGFKVGNPRLPLVALSKPELEKLRELLIKFNKISQ
ncbi:Dihydrodipicolinate synthase [Thermodesulfobium narugense DSM 14796]|uniref:4-hydroxy-tetrahydrodipicolinate synthase n=1 Tax=Thermodesulfobium narugense DSM 14796 TaxID=747365 RepID=M1E855_9BACT|nr:4-hydroxy-tetrahydrodipicolinate synthase [Thermodesulfobium narugense]AEE14284.1 Dihydrodipicolinate synthase [Thermodesulfobium narugense DSM 14796]